MLLFSANYTALQMKNSRKGTSATDPVTMEKYGRFVCPNYQIITDSNVKAQYTVLQTMNSIRSASVINLVTT